MIAPARAESQSGLGTGFGEERDSQVGRTDFVRADGNRPTAVDRIYYNDREGIQAMLGHEGGSDRHAGGRVPMADGLVSVGLKDGGGSWLNGRYRGRRFVAGERGERYEIVVHNETRDRIEVVLSVDGLDVMDGRAASFSKSGATSCMQATRFPSMVSERAQTQWPHSDSAAWIEAMPR